MRTAREVTSRRFEEFRWTALFLLSFGIALCSFPQNRAEAADPNRARLANVSTRGFAGRGVNALIAGVIIRGNDPKKVIILARGPSLPLAGILSDPDLVLYANPGLEGDNDDWMDAPNVGEIINSTLAPPRKEESAILVSLWSNAFTAAVYPKGETREGSHSWSSMISMQIQTPSW